MHKMYIFLFSLSSHFRNEKLGKDICHDIFKLSDARPERNICFELSSSNSCYMFKFEQSGLCQRSRITMGITECLRFIVEINLCSHGSYLSNLV